VWFTPTVGAGKIALINNRRHLHAGMALYTVEGSFVAGTISEQGFFGPMACFDTTVFADNVISLLLQFSFECGVHAHEGSS
tara:strand:- start:279 stop:521 length:243 start_codon:yes stop_codon:yes gene_type:complete